MSLLITRTYYVNEKKKDNYDKNKSTAIEMFFVGEKKNTQKKIVIFSRRSRKKKSWKIYIKGQLLGQLLGQRRALVRLGTRRFPTNDGQTRRHLIEIRGLDLKKKITSREIKLSFRIDPSSIDLVSFG